MSSSNTGDFGEFDRATARRLARLRTMPVELAGLEEAIRAQIPPAVTNGGQEDRRRAIGAWLRPARAVAAVLVVAVAVTLVLLTSSSGPALASTEHMARMHEDLVSGRVPVMEVNTLEEATRMLSGKTAAAPSLPTLPQTGASQPAAHVMACCMKSVGDKKVACVLLKTEGVPITMAVADAKDMRLPKSATVVREGTTYHVQSTGPLNMVMTEREGRWVCMMAELPVERLISIASALKF